MNASGRRRISVIIVGVLAAVVFAETGARVLASRLPHPLQWQSAEADMKVSQMDVLAKRGGADIVFTGSSIVNAGIDPALAARLIGSSASVYDAALTAAVPELIAPWALRVVIPRLHPKLLVIGLSSFDVTDGPAASKFFQNFADSPGGRQALGREDSVQRIDRWLGDHSALWEHKFDLRDPSALLRAVRGEDPPPDNLIARVDEHGKTIYKLSQHFTPVGDVDTPAFGWKLGSENPAALEDLLQQTKSQGIRVVLVDMPVTNEYVQRHPNGEADYQRFIAAVREIGERTGTPVLDFDAMRDHALFGDVVHLNAGGAEALTPKIVDGLRAAGVLAGLGG